LVQSVCREVLEKRGNYHYQGDAAFQSWLFQVALHKLMDRRRYWGAVKRAPAEGAAPPRAKGEGWNQSQLARLAVTLFTPSRDAMLHEDLARLEEALDALSDADREIIRLIHLDGLSHAEAGLQLGCSESQSRKRLFHALARLSKRFVHAANGRADPS
jgi:RNA polymerase sigma factor (sigma-70 family)